VASRPAENWTKKLDVLVHKQHEFGGGDACAQRAHHAQTNQIAAAPEVAAAVTPSKSASASVSLPTWSSEKSASHLPLAWRNLESPAFTLSWVDNFHAQNLTELEAGFDAAFTNKWHCVAADRHGNAGATQSR
jgi:hypothetical protein